MIGLIAVEGPGMTETPFPNGETPFGRLYAPKRTFIQFATFAFAFFGGPLAGMMLGTLLGGLSEGAQIALYIPFFAVFFLGYGLWVSRLNMLGFNLIGRGLLKMVFMALIFRRMPKSIDEVLPSADKIVEAAVKAQKAGWSFLIMAFPVAGVAMFGGLIIDADMGAVERVGLIGVACLMWGYALGWLARHGFLPFAECE